MSETASARRPTFTETARNSLMVLETGDSISICKRVPLDGKSPANVSAHIELLRTRYSAPVAQVQHATGRKFTTETGTFLKRAGDLMAVCAVTRMS